MERKITIRILDRKFSVVAESPEQEHDMREAAENVDKKFYEYRRRLPGKSEEDILSIIAFNGFLEISRLERMLEERNEDDDVLLEKLRSYLGNIDEK